MLHVSYVAFQEILWLIICMKQTPEDEEYAQRFGQSLEKAYTAAKSSGITDEVFAASIGVKRSALKKYLQGESTPGLRTVVLAKRNHQISVAYGGIEVDAFRAKTKENADRTALQLRLPFSLQIAQREKVQVELKELKSMKYELRISVKREASPRPVRKKNA